MGGPDADLICFRGNARAVRGSIPPGGSQSVVPGPLRQHPLGTGCMTHSPGCHPGPARRVRRLRAPVWFPESLPGTPKKARLAAPLTRGGVSSLAARRGAPSAFANKAFGGHRSRHVTPGVTARTAGLAKPHRFLSGLCRPGLVRSGGGGGGQPSVPVVTSSESRLRLPLVSPWGKGLPLSVPRALILRHLGRPQVSSLSL